MKRAVIWMLLLISLSVGVPSSAAVNDSTDAVPPSGQGGVFYCEYVPKSERSTLFYIDVYSTVEVSAAMMELTFDDGIADYREVSAAERTSCARAACSGGCVKIVFADSGAVKGKLCRVTFKAIRTGAVTFTLHIAQAADAATELLGAVSDASVRVKLGKTDAAASPSSTVSVRSSSKSDRSYSNRYDDDSDSDGARHQGNILDLRNDHHVSYILIGIGITLSAAALTAVGVILGRRSARKKKPEPPKAAPQSDEPESDEPQSGESQSGKEP